MGVGGCVCVRVGVGVGVGVPVFMSALLVVIVYIYIHQGHVPVRTHGEEVACKARNQSHNTHHS